MENKVLYVVPIIDTEGPTLGREDMVDSWDTLHDVVSELTGPVRDELRDSFGNPLVINWFMLDWTGYSKNDAEFKKRGHDTQLHAVWNFYKKHFFTKDALEKWNDGLYWHYHHPPKDGSWGWNLNWSDSNWYEYILGKLILDHGYFPSMYRAGKYVENNLNSHWLENWIPFDYSNISPVKRDFCDWSEATTSWVPYHPSYENYQKPGAMKRMVGRSLPVAAKGGSGLLDPKEIEKAFEQVAAGESAVFSFHTHDYYKSILDEFRQAHKLIDDLSKKYGIKWKYENALNAMRLHVKDEQIPLSISVQKTNDLKIQISTNHETFCKQPFVVSEDKDGSVKRIDAIEIRPGEFEAQLPIGTVRYGVGVNDAYGHTATFSETI